MASARGSCAERSRRSRLSTSRVRHPPRHIFNLWQNSRAHASARAPAAATFPALRLHQVVSSSTGMSACPESASPPPPLLPSYSLNGSLTACSAITRRNSSAMQQPAADARSAAPAVPRACPPPPPALRPPPSTPRLASAVARRARKSEPLVLLCFYLQRCVYQRAALQARFRSRTSELHLPLTLPCESTVRRSSSSRPQNFLLHFLPDIIMR